MNSSTLPKPVALIVNRYQRLIEQHTPQLVAGLYLHGSIALDAFSDGASDIDFIAFLSRAAEDKDIRTLEQAHSTIAREHPRCAMEGGYLQWHDLGRPSETIAPYPCYYDARMHRSARHDINPVTWWMLKNRGVVIFGPEPATLDFSTRWDQVRAYMVTNLNTYWAEYTQSPRRLITLFGDEGVQWSVLGVCRLFYGLQEGAMISKQQAGDYALTQTPERWHSLIREALGLRSGAKPRRYASRLARARDTVAFLRYVIARCNTL